MYKNLLANEKGEVRGLSEDQERTLGRNRITVARTTFPRDPPTAAFCGLKRKRLSLIAALRKFGKEDSALRTHIMRTTVQTQQDRA
jgi:hypothetical protein